MRSISALSSLENSNLVKKSGKLQGPPAAAQLHTFRSFSAVKTAVLASTLSLPPLNCRKQLKRDSTGSLFKARVRT